MKLTEKQYARVGRSFVNAFEDVAELFNSEDVVDEDPGVDEDPYPWLTKVREWNGLHEDHNTDELRQIFRDAGFEFDPALPWCGAGARAGLVHGGAEDPGPARYQAAKYATYGEDATDDPRVGDLWVSDTHVAFIEAIRDDGVFMLNGGNQNNQFCVLPAQNRSGKKNFGDVIAIRRPRRV